MHDPGLRWVADRLAELRVRLSLIRPPSLAIPLVGAAACPPAALQALERGVRVAVGRLTRGIEQMERTVTRAGLVARQFAPVANRRLTALQLHTDSLYRTLDLFGDAIATRADAEMGLMLAGVDRLVAAALDRDVPGYRPPLAVSYLDSGGRGGAIARARTRLPGDVVLPVALVRVSPETLPTRLTSALHEAGHQLATDLHLLEEARTVMRAAAQAGGADDESAQRWASYASEVVPDQWAIDLGGAPAVDGLQRVLSLPAALLYLVRDDDPHPPGVARVAFAIAYARLTRPDPLLDALEERFAAVYGGGDVPATLRRRALPLVRSAAAVARALAAHRFAGLGARTVAASSAPGTLGAARMRRAVASPCLRSPAALAQAPPLAALAALGCARLLGVLDAAGHARLCRAWLQRLAQYDHSHSACGCGAVRHTAAAPRRRGLFAEECSCRTAIA